MVAHRRLGDVQARGDIPVLAPRAHEGDDVAFAGREGGQLGGLGAARGDRAGVLQLGEAYDERALF